ncbi:MAG: hypothetical protein PVH29_08800, partial [Candidatus Zixiibacteriota bacterium]
MTTRRLLLTSFLAILIAATAWAALGDIVSSFAAPDTAVRGLARSSNRLFLLTYGTPTTIYRLAPVTGSIFGSWSPTFGDYCRGLAYSQGNHLWVGSYENDVVYDCRPKNGSVYGSWDADGNAYGLAPFCTGDGGVGTTAIIASDSRPNSYCWLHDLSNGSVMSSFGLPHSSFFDIAWDHRNQLIWMGTTTGTIYGYSIDGSVVATFTSPDTYPYGMAYSSQYL